MPDMERLHLEDALEDSPQTRHLLMVFEKDAMQLKKFTINMHSCCQRIMSAQNELCAATQALAQQLRAYEIQKFPLESEDSILTSTLKQFSSYLDDISSIHQVLAQQFSETMMYPLNKFLQADLEEVTTMHEMFQMASQEHEQTLTRYMKLPRKKEERSRVEANEDLFSMRKKFHQTALHYYSALNALQYKRKCQLLEPVLGYLHAQRAFFPMGQDAVCKKEVEDFLSNIGASVQGVHAELGQETKRTVDLIDTIEKQSAHLYHAEPPIDMPFIPPNTGLAQKAGYLMHRSRQALIASKWERLYFFTQGGNLMCQSKDEVIKNQLDEVAGKLMLDLNEEGVLAEPAEVEDRRFTFQVTSPQSKKTIILQAENSRERDEWIATINNIVRDGGYVKGKSSLKKKDESTNQLGSELASPRQQSPGLETGSLVPSTTITPVEGLNLDAPIQFDLVSPVEGGLSLTPLIGPPKRINPFDQSGSELLSTPYDNAAFAQNFTVRFLGSMEVKQDRGEQLVHATIRQIMAARAIHNVFKMTESIMNVTSEGIRLLDPSTNSARVEFALQDVSFWATHPENNRLLGFITRNRSATPPGPNPVPGSLSFACHVFETNNSAEDICQAIKQATNIAFQALMDRKKGRTPQKPKPQPIINDKDTLWKPSETGRRGSGEIYLLVQTVDICAEHHRLRTFLLPQLSCPTVIKAEVGQGESAAISPDMCPDEESEA
ncbi:DCC-interacting protein 13-alpha-like isoform X2 [Pomacea canaliculata]|uniref:DCC-interacting protein 13-alpha-like isoform X2 n=1 Tax=Pomacea canaliculata TaxID=400727 RepID=UPI000D729182|nr:DCC-interacting protein 13-alpha-like isoform X2 [Pomacea canaliculata]